MVTAACSGTAQHRDVFSLSPLDSDRQYLMIENSFWFVTHGFCFVGFLVLFPVLIQIMVSVHFFFF